MNASNPSPAKYVILVGVDLTEASERALSEAFDLASRHDAAEVHIVHAIPGMPPLAAITGAPDLIAATTPASTSLPDQLTLDLARTVKAHLEKAVSKKQQERANGIRWLIHISIMDPVHAVVQLAADVEADLIVIGTQSRRGLRRFVLGSVAESVVRVAPCLVLVVRPRGALSAVEAPQIEPPCPECLAIRRASSGAEFWCERHRQHHGRAHTYHLTSFRDSHQSGLLFHPLD